MAPLCLSSGAIAAPAPQAAKAVYSIVHVDVPPDRYVASFDALRRYVEGQRGIEALERMELDRQQAPLPFQMTLIGVWSNATALDAHRSATATLSMRAALASNLSAPWNEHLYTARMSIEGPSPGARGDGGVPVVVVTRFAFKATEVDAGWRTLDGAMATVRSDTEGLAGLERLEVLEEIGDPGSGVIIERWRDREAFEARRATDLLLEFWNLKPRLAEPFDVRVSHPSDERR